MYVLTSYFNWHQRLNIMSEQKKQLLGKRLPSPLLLRDKPSRLRRWFGTSPKEYQGQSRWGPCTFYYFPDTYTWLVRCRNKYPRKTEALPLLIDHPDGRDFYDDVDIMQALDNPGIIPLCNNGDVANSSKEHSGYTQTRRNSYTHKDLILMDYYTNCMFQRLPLKIGNTFDTHRGVLTIDQHLIDFSVGFAESLKYETDGNWIWVAWRDTDRLHKETGICDDILNNILLPMINVSAGYTGFYKASPVITRDDDNGHIRVDCTNNLSFWAEVYTK